MQLRLVAGPLNDAGAAAKICAVLTENKRTCETTIFDGQRLSLNGRRSAAGTAAKPASHRRGVAQAARPVAVEEPPKKPETTPRSTISSMFGRRSANNI